MEDDGKTVFSVIVLLVFVLFYVFLAPVACVDATNSDRVLRDAGYQNVSVGGYGWFACDEKDMFSTKFTAVAPNGAQVRGVVCSGWLKGHTIRFK